MAERLRFDVGFGRPAPRRRFGEGDGEAMRILLLADFGRRSGALGERSPQRIDVDDFEQVLRRQAPRLTLPAAAGDDGPTVIEFHELDAFHPDSLYEAVPAFAPLRAVRARLLDPATAPAAIAELTGGAAASVPAPTPTKPSEADFERLLGQRQGPATTPATAAVADFIRRVIEPHVVPAADPRAADLVAAVDAAIGDRMGRILHDPGFQALEAAWRAAHWLVTSLETDETLQLYLLDVSKAEIAADIAAAGDDLEHSALYQLLMRHGPGMPGGAGWSVLAGDYRFGADDVQVLAALGAIGAQVGGPFLAEADASILGCRSLVETPDERGWEAGASEHWRALRKSAAARWLGLALPRVLLRVPYGRDSDPAERFRFEEMPSPPQHEAYLWGSPAFACALLLGQSWADAGAAMTPGDRTELLDLPSHSYGDAGARAVTPPGEVLLSERTADAILARGLMPMLSFKNRNAVRVARFQSIADPPTELSGPWA